MEKEEKVGLFRRLFGKGDEELDDLQPKQPKVVNVSSPLELTQTDDGNKEEVLPWEQSNRQESSIETDPSLHHAPEGSFDTPKAQPSDRTPTWEELLNKIVPPGQESDTEPVMTSQLLREQSKADSPSSAACDISVKSEGAVAPGRLTEPKGTTINSAQSSMPLELIKESQKPKTEPIAQPELIMEAAVEEVQEAILVQEVALEVLEQFSNTEEYSAKSKPEQKETEFIAAVALKAKQEKEAAKVIEFPTTEKLSETIVLEQVPVIKLTPGNIPPIKNEQVLWLIEQAGESTSQGEVSKAKKFLEIAFNLEQHPDVAFAMARHEKALGNLNAATDLCEQSLSLFEDNRDVIELLMELVEEGASPNVKALSAIDSGDVQVNTNLARLFLSKGSLDSALNFFTKAQVQGLAEDDIQFELGYLFDQMGDLTKAKEHYHRALELNGSSDSLDTACRLFDLTLQLGLVAEAKSVAKKYLRGKNVPEIKLRLAEFDLQEGMDQFNKQNFDEALNSFYAAMENGEETARSWVVKTLLLIADSSHDYVEAIEHFEAALEIGGYNRELAEKIAEKYFAQENYAKAIEYLHKIHEQAPMDTKIISTYANSLQKIGDYESAAQLLESLSQMGAMDVPTREQLFNYYRTKGRYEDAKRHFELLYTPGTEGYNNGLQALAWDQIRLMVEQGEDAKAWVICSRELRNNPSSDMLGLAMKILSERVDSLVAENKVKEALHELEEGRALGLNVLDLGLREASLYETIGNDQAALKVYGEIAKKAPEVWGKVKELYLKAATREYLAGNLSDSRRLLEDAYAKLPDNLEIRRALGVLYQETGQYALAAALAQNLIEETDIQVPTDHLNVLRPHGYRRIRLG